MNRLEKTTLLILVLPLCISILLGSIVYTYENRFLEKYEKISLGASEMSLINNLGSPDDEISNRLKEKKLCYKTFLNSYIFFFNEDRKLITKYKDNF